MASKESSSNTQPSQTCTEVAFTDPYTARLLKLRNILLSRPVLDVPGESGVASQMVLEQPVRPTFEEMMAVVNRPRRRRG